MLNTCPKCGEVLDIGAVGCRACGEGLETSEEEGVTFDVLDDELGEWSQIKHHILEKYATAYMTIVAAQSHLKGAIYIDAFAGTGYGVDRETGEPLPGSAIRAMDVRPPFAELHFVEQDEGKADVLEYVTALDPRVKVHRGDGIAVVRDKLLKRCRWDDYRRALCLLDPYDLSVPWSLVQTIGAMGSVEIFYNFMIMDANRNVLWNRPERLPPDRLPKMDAVWGDRSWQQAFYTDQGPDLFGDSVARKLPNAEIAEAFRQRLRTVAKFKYVPQPIAMKNSIGATVYYLFFATHNKSGAKIVEDIFRKYRR